MIILDKVYLEPKTVTRDKEGPYIIIKGSVYQENITIMNTYALTDLRTT